MDELKLNWWKPPKERVVAVHTGGRVVFTSIISDDVVLCDLCGAPILTRPVPVLWSNYAACGDCLKRSIGLSLEAAAQRDGVQLMMEQEW